VSADNVTGSETDSDDAPAEAGTKVGAWSSSDDGLAPVGELVDGETACVSISGDLACGDEPEENHLRVAGIGTGTVSDRGRPSTLAGSSLGGVGGMMFITGDCVVPEIGRSFRAESMGDDGSCAGRTLLARLEDSDDDDGDDEGANQARFLGISLVSDSG
jgi:hypothetical protein